MISRRWVRGPGRRVRAARSPGGRRCGPRCPGPPPTHDDRLHEPDLRLLRQVGGPREGRRLQDGGARGAGHGHREGESRRAPGHAVLSHRAGGQVPRSRGTSRRRTSSSCWRGSPRRRDWPRRACRPARPAWRCPASPTSHTTSCCSSGTGSPRSSPTGSPAPENTSRLCSTPCRAPSVPRMLR